MPHADVLGIMARLKKGSSTEPKRSGETSTLPHEAIMRAAEEDDEEDEQGGEGITRGGVSTTTPVTTTTTLTAANDVGGYYDTALHSGAGLTTMRRLNCLQYAR